MEPFFLSCTTCKARLRVRDETAVGQIVACPKCGSMVLIELPESLRARQPLAESQASMADTVDGPLLLSDVVSETRPSQSGTEPLDDDAAPSGIEDETASGEARALVPQEIGAQAAQPLLPDDQWVSAATRRARQRILTVAAAAVGVFLAVAAFGLLNYGRPRADLPPVAGAGRQTTAEEEPGVEPVPPPLGAEPQKALASDDSRESLDSSDGQPRASLETAKKLADASPARPPKTAAGVERAEDAGAAADLGAERRAAEQDVPADHPPDLMAAGDEAQAVDPGTLAETLNAVDALVEQASEVPGVEPDNSASAAPEEVPAATPPRPLPPKSDVPRLLQLEILGVEFNNVAIIDVLRDIGDMTTIPISLDPDAVALGRLPIRAPVSLKLQSTTVAGLLDEALTPLRLVYQVAEGHVVVTDQEQAAGGLIPVTYPVSDLAASEEQLQQLEQLIARLIAPDSWAPVGGSGVLQAEGRSLEAEQTPHIHAQIELFLRRLRAARKQGQSAATSGDALLPRFEQARPKLDSRLTVNFARPAMLSRILVHVGKEAGLQFVVDWRAAEQAGWTPQVEASVTAVNEPLRDVLANLLSPLDLTCRVLDESTILITTPQAESEHLEVEFFPVAEQLAAGASGSQLVERMKTVLGQKQFRESGGRCTIVFDAPSQCLLAALPQPLARLLSQTLADWKSGG